jgi:hypothetical protein
MTQDVMTSYHIKTGVIEVRFMKIGDKGFNVAKSLKEFIPAARESDKEFSIMPIHNKGDNLCRATGVPNTKEGIGNITGTLSNAITATAPCRLGHQWTSEN